eukprot:12033697-Ditylum_brightwellii.AAC.1
MEEVNFCLVMGEAGGAQWDEQIVVFHPDVCFWVCEEVLLHPLGLVLAQFGFEQVEVVVEDKVGQ